MQNPISNHICISPKLSVVLFQNLFYFNIIRFCTYLKSRINYCQSFCNVNIIILDISEQKQRGMGNAIYNMNTQQENDTNEGWDFKRTSVLP